jgi:hypothetical protein
MQDSWGDPVHVCSRPHLPPPSSPSSNTPHTQTHTPLAPALPPTRPPTAEVYVGLEGGSTHTEGLLVRVGVVLVGVAGHV